MDRIALAKRLEGLSSVFASETPFNRDLKAMSFVLSKLSDEKFASILASDFNPDVGITEEVDACGMGVNPMITPEDQDKKVLIIKTPNKEEAAVMSEEATDKTAGMYWNKESSEAVVNYLLRDIVGMQKTICCDTGSKLEANQIPDGSHKGVPLKPNTLTPEQTPDIAASLDTNMVKKSDGAVRKEAGSKKGPGIPDGTGPMKDSPQCKMKDKKEEKKASEKEDEDKIEEKDSAEKEAKISDVEKSRAERKEDEAEKAHERAEKAEEKEQMKEEDKEEDKESCMKKEANSSFFEGIELTASMDEVTLGDAEAKMLSKLFE